MLDKNERFKVKVIIIILCIITLLILGFSAIDYFIINDQQGVSFFVEHFSAGICLIIIGIIAGLLTMIGKKKYSEAKADDMMIIVAGLLLLCGLISILYSFLI